MNKILSKIAWILVLVLAIIVSWLYMNGKKEKSVSDTSYKSLQARISDTSKYYAEYILRADSNLSNATAMAIQLGEKARQSQLNLDQARGRINSLLILLDSSAKEKPDSSWVQVSPDYKWGCDSLRKANASLNGLVDQYEQDNQAHVDALGYETTVRDSALQRERIYSKIFQQQLVTCMNALNDEEKAKRRVQLYAGMAAWGNSITPLGGGEINLGLKTRSDQFYEIKGTYIGTWWVGIGTKFKITLKQ